MTHSIIRRRCRRRCRRHICLAASVLVFGKCSPRLVQSRFRHSDCTSPRRGEHRRRGGRCGTACGHFCRAQTSTRRRVGRHRSCFDPTARDITDWPWSLAPRYRRHPCIPCPYAKLSLGLRTYFHVFANGCIIFDWLQGCVSRADRH